MTTLVNYYVNLNSKDRLNRDQTSPSDFAIQIKDIINLKSRKLVYVCPIRACIPPTWYIVNQYNNTMMIVENTVPSTIAKLYTVTLTQGNYDVNTFMSAFTSAMTAQSAILGYAQTYSATYSNITGKITITNANPLNFTFTFVLGMAGDDLGAFLGFSAKWANTGYLNPNTGFIVSPDVVDFTTAIPAIYIRSNLYRIGTGYDTSQGVINFDGSALGASSDILAIINVTQNGFQNVIYDNSESVPDRRVKVIEPFNQFLQLKLTSDDYNQIINLNGSDWCLTLLFQYYE